MLLTLCIISGARMQVGEWPQEIAEFAVHGLPKFAAINSCPSKTELCMSQLTPTRANNFSCMKCPKVMHSSAFSSVIFWQQIWPPSIFLQLGDRFSILQGSLKVVLYHSLTIHSTG